MEANTIIVEIIENSQADLIALPVVRLGAVGTKIVSLTEIDQIYLQNLPSSIGPVDSIILLSRWPANGSTTHLSTSPEVLLILSSNKA